MNKPFRAIALGVACCSIGVLTGTVVANAVSGTPEIDRANATIQVTGNLKPVMCVGEDSVGAMPGPVLSTVMAGIESVLSTTAPLASVPTRWREPV